MEREPLRAARALQYGSSNRMRLHMPCMLPTKSIVCDDNLALKE